MTDHKAGSALLDVFAQLDIELVRGEGVWVWDTSGKKYLDFYGGHAVALLGYAHPKLVSVIERQARELFFYSNIVPLAVRERAAQALVRLCPPGLTRVFFSNSGAEANENALRIAFVSTGRKRVVAVEGGFHGRTAGSAAATDKAKWYGFPAKPFETTFVPFNDVEALEKALTEDVAAFIVEPIQGVAGARDCSAAFLKAARAATRKAGALLVFDEVQCGVGRPGHPFAAQAYDVCPDILTTAKGLGGGFPVGATVVGEALASKLKKGDLGTTFGGGPLACAMVEAALTAMQEEDLLPRVQRLSARLRKECVVGPVTAVQGMGYLLGLKVPRPASEVSKALRERGILVGGSSDPNVVRLLPPLVLEDSHVDALVGALKELE